MKNRFLPSVAILLLALLPLAIAPVSVMANPIPYPTLLMPEEWINVRVDYVPVAEAELSTNVPLSASVEGIYPMQNLGYKQVKMLDPVPAGSCKIAVSVDGKALPWSWSDQKYTTILPEWPAIPELFWEITPVPDQFKLNVLYEHNLIRRPNEMVFMYPMGCWEGQPIYSSRMTAHMKVNLPGRYLPKGVYLDYSPAPFKLAPTWLDNTQTIPSWQVTGDYSGQPYHALDKDYILLLMDRWQDPQAWFSQPPDMANGYDIISMDTVNCPPPVDDFILRASPAENKNISSLRFWGSYPGWLSNNPDAQYLDCLQPRPAYFSIYIYDSIDTDVKGTIPGHLVYKARVSEFSQSYFGMVVRPGITEESSVVPNPAYTYEHKFEFNLGLAKPFYPLPGQRYWLSIVAGPVTGAKTWGWATSPVEETYPAWAIDPDPTTYELRDVKELSTYAQAETAIIPAKLHMAFSLVNKPEPVTVKTTHYKLVEGSTLTVEWLPAGGDAMPPVMQLPLTGEFDLAPVIDYTASDVSALDTAYSVYQIANMEFRPKSDPTRYWGHNGQGTYLLSKPLSTVQTQQMKLAINIDRSAPIPFYSGLVKVPADINFPWIDIKLSMLNTQGGSNGSYYTGPYYTLHLVAVPWTNVNFSTTTSFTSGSLEANQKLSDGDLLNANGKVTLYDHELISKFKLYPTLVEQQPGLDAVMGPLYNSLSCTTCPPEFWFSTVKDILAEEKPGNGDVLSNTGRIILRNADLIAPFSPMPPIPPCGLDVLASCYIRPLPVPVDNEQVLTDAELNITPDLLDPAKPLPEVYKLLLFSTKVSFFSERLGVLVGHGDLLRRDGKIYKTNKQLMANFKPVIDATTDKEGFGLDAVYVWSNGEIWFSVEKDFQDTRLGVVRNGDLLSTNGRIILRNLDLLAPYKPLEKLIDFGLDALSVGN